MSIYPSVETLGRRTEKFLFSRRRSGYVFCEIEVFERYTKNTFSNILERSIGNFSVNDWSATFDMIQWLSINIGEFGDIHFSDPYDFPFKISIKAIDFGIKDPLWMKYMYYEQFLLFMQYFEKRIGISIISNIPVSISKIQMYKRVPLDSIFDITRGDMLLGEIRIELRSHGDMRSNIPQIVALYKIFDWKVTKEIIGFLSTHVEDVNVISNKDLNYIPFIVYLKAPKFGIQGKGWKKYMDYLQCKYLYLLLENQLKSGKVIKARESAIPEDRLKSFIIG